MRVTYAVWELTLKCNLACQHCGSRAGEARSDELTTTEALDLVAQLAEVGIKEVTLIGGEAYLRADWLKIVAAIVAAGMSCTLTTGGYGISAELARRMRAVGIDQVSISIDGLEATHDRLRGKRGSWQACLQTIEHLRAAGLRYTCNTQINRLSAPEMPQIYRLIRDAGVSAWQLQLTVPMGNAADHSEILLQPCELLDLFPMLARIAMSARREGMDFFAGNNIGYYGPYERLLRGMDSEWGFWVGCQAGLSTLGIEADGKIKGCPSLPTAAYVGGNIRDRRLKDIITAAPELTFNLAPELTINLKEQAPDASLWGFCRSCEYAELCRGGCSWTAHVFFNRRGNNPYCHHRATVQAQRGLRERFVQLKPAFGRPFDNGEFVIIEEPLDAPWPDNDPLHFTAEAIEW